MNTHVTLFLDVPGLGADERVSARFLAGDAFKYAVDKFRDYGVQSVAFSRNTVTVVLTKVESLDFRAVILAAEVIETILQTAFHTAKRAAQDEIETSPRLPETTDPASG